MGILFVVAMVLLGGFICACYSVNDWLCCSDPRYQEKRQQGHKCSLSFSGPLFLVLILVLVNATNFLLQVL